MAHHTAKLELLIDDQNEEKQYARQRKTTGIPQVAQVPPEGHWQDDYNTDNDEEEVSLQEPAPRETDNHSDKLSTKESTQADTPRRQPDRFLPIVRGDELTPQL